MHHIPSRFKFFSSRSGRFVPFREKADSSEQWCRGVNTPLQKNAETLSWFVDKAQNMPPQQSDGREFLHHWGDIAKRSPMTIQKRYHRVPTLIGDSPDGVGILASSETGRANACPAWATIDDDKKYSSCSYGMEQKRRQMKKLTSLCADFRDDFTRVPLRLIASLCLWPVKGTQYNAPSQLTA